MILSHALRTIPKTTKTLFVDGNSIANQASDSSRTLTLSTHNIGDMLIAMIGNRTATPPTLLSGYTNIVSDGNTASGASRSYRVQYKIATTTSETISWTGAYGFIVAVRNATSIGVTNVVDISSSSTSPPLPDLTGLNTSGNESVIAGSYLSSAVTGGTSPYILYAPSSTANRFAVYVENNTNASLTSKTLNTSLAAMHITWAIELLT